MLIKRTKCCLTCSAVNVSFRAHLAAIDGHPGDDSLCVTACGLSEMRKKMFTLVVMTVCKQINNEYSLLPKDHSFFKD